VRPSCCQPDPAARETSNSPALSIPHPSPVILILLYCSLVERGMNDILLHGSSHGSRGHTRGKGYETTDEEALPDNTCPGVLRPAIARNPQCCVCVFSFVKNRDGWTKLTRASIILGGNRRGNTTVHGHAPCWTFHVGRQYHRADPIHPSSPL
jgi:hypothetical protein